VPQCCVICTVPLLFSYFLNAAVFLCTVSSSTIFVKGSGCSWLSLRYCRCISKNECRKLLNISSHTAELLSETGTRISGALKLHWFSYIGWGTSLSQKKPAITASSSKSFVWMQAQLSVFCFSRLTHRHNLKLQLRPWKRMTLVRTYFHLFHYIRHGFGSLKCLVLHVEGQAIQELTTWPWHWRYYNTSKHWKLHTKCYNIRSQKNLIIISCIVW